MGPDRANWGALFDWDGVVIDLLRLLQAHGVPEYRQH
jgi:hypothetical protein